MAGTTAQTIARGSLVLVTGASGYIATHIVLELLKRGYRVRGTVRSEDKGNLLKQKLYKEFGDKFEYVIVESLLKEQGFHEAVKGVDGILHVASPLPRPNAPDVWKDIIEPARAGTLSILNAAVERGTSVKRIVITSSYASVADASKGPGAVYTEDDWNHSAIKAAEELGSGIPQFAGYIASKTWAELAAWDFVKTPRSFDIATILPPYVLGPVLTQPEQPSGLPFCNYGIWQFLTGSPDSTAASATVGPVLPVVDVRDVAYAHVEALLRPEAGGIRIATSYGPPSYQRFLDAIYADAELRAAFPDAIWGKLGAADVHPRKDQDNKRSIELLGLKYTDISQTARDIARNLLEGAKEKGWAVSGASESAL